MRATYRGGTWRAMVRLNREDIGVRPFIRLWEFGGTRRRERKGRVRLGGAIEDRRARLKPHRGGRTKRVSYFGGFYFEVCANSVARGRSSRTRDAVNNYGITNYICSNL